MQLELWLARHGESLGNADGTEGDTALTEKGRQQARALGQLLCQQNFDGLWVSPLHRARETAQLALPNMPMQLDRRLREFVPKRKAYLGPGNKLPLGRDELLQLLQAQGNDHPIPEPTETGALFAARIQNVLKDLPVRGRFCIISLKFQQKKIKKPRSFEHLDRVVA